ncbi:MAG: carboxypeptidase-like regulatory domain-containing protein [Acidobacteriaceae bacterium]
MGKAVRLAILLCLSSCVTGLIFAQNTNSGDIRGTVTDQSGAVVPGVKVTVLDVDKNVTTTFVTDGAGLYDTGSIVPDHYLLTFTKAGFATYQRGPVTLEAGITTVNGLLKVGEQTQKILVTTDLPLLTTETGSQSATLQSKSLMDLPQVGADWENFIQLLPGVSNTNYNMGNEASSSTASINGSLPYNTVLADGAVNTVPMSMNANVSVLETVQEVKVDTSTFSAQYSAGGAIFNQISKGGTDRFHGAGYELFQNNALNAAPYSFGQNAPVPILHYNNYGLSVGGPILPKRLFFFFDYDNTVDNGGALNGITTVPTDAMRAGDFTGQPTIYDPTTQTVDAAGVVHRQSFASEYNNGNKIPANMIDSVAKAIQAYYPEPNRTGTTVNGITTNNFFYNAPNSNPYRKYFGRLDYNVTPANHMVISETEQNNPAVFINQGICPVNCQNGDGSSDAAQVSDVWTIRPDTMNEARFGFTDALAFYTPFSINQGFPAKLGWKFAKADVFPDILFYGGCCLELEPESNAVYKQTAFDPSDVVTLIRGRHVLHFGGEILIDRADSTAWGNINGGQMQFNGEYTAATQGATNTSGVPYADFLLGQVNEWNAQVTPEYGGRLKFPQAFVQDDIKVHPNFTLNVGLRWQGTTGWSEVKGNMRSFDPTVINPANNTPGATWYGFSHANGRTTLQAPVWDTFLPRFGFSYQVHPDTVVRGGVGLYAYTWSIDSSGGGMGTAFGSSGSSSDSTNGAYDVVQLDSDGNSTAQPSGQSINSLYLTAPTTPQAYNGQPVSYNEYHNPVPKIIEWTVSVQRELGRNMVAELAYVASHGYALNFPVDINQVPAGKLSPNDAVCTPGSTTCGRPYPLFQGISGSTNNANSNYNSLQASITQRLSHGLQFNANYTWSHMLDNIDSSGWGGYAGSQNFQSSYNPSANYGASNFDVRNAFKASAVYDLPVGRGQRFLSSNGVLDRVVGGWQVAPTIVWTSGSPFTPIMANDTSYAQAGALYPDQVGNPHAGQHSIDQWFNSAAYAPPAPATFGDVRRNSLYGPDYLLLNGALGKTFHFGEGISMEIRGEADNVINHPSFGLPNSAIGPGQVSSITSVTVGGRTMQLYGRLSF